MQVQKRSNAAQDGELERQMIALSGSTAPSSGPRGENRIMPNLQRTFDDSLAGQLYNGITEFGETVNGNMRSVENARLMRRFGKDLDENGLENVKEENLINALRVASENGADRPKLKAELLRRNTSTSANVESQASVESQLTPAENQFINDTFVATVSGSQREEVPAAIDMYKGQGGARRWDERPDEPAVIGGPRDGMNQQALIEEAIRLGATPEQLNNAINPRGGSLDQTLNLSPTSDEGDASNWSDEKWAQYLQDTNTTGSIQGEPGQSALLDILKQESPDANVPGRNTPRRDVRRAAYSQDSSNAVVAGADGQPIRVAAISDPLTRLRVIQALENGATPKEIQKILAEQIAA